MTSFAMFIVQQPNKSRNEECPASALGIIIFEVAEFKHQLMTCLGVLIYSEAALFYSSPNPKLGRDGPTLLEQGLQVQPAEVGSAGTS